jgi:hypothetical protein
MKFGDWILKEEEKEDFGTPDALDLISSKKFKEIVKKALAIDDPPSKFDDKYKLISLKQINDNITMLNTAASIMEGEVDTESDEEKKEWKIATFQDIKDSEEKWKKYEEERMGEFEEPEEEEPEEEGGEEEAPPEEEEEEV